MEQYWMRKRNDLSNLKRALRHYTPTNIYIRDCGGYNPDGSFRAQGLRKVNQDLEGKLLQFVELHNNLFVCINKSRIFTFNNFSKRYKGFSLAYERTEQTKDGPRMVMLPSGFNPYDCHLPEPDSSILRTIIDEHLMEITFKGRVHLKQDGWLIKPHWLYWNITDS